MQHKLSSEYAGALKSIAQDSAVRAKLSADPVGTLKGLGVNIPAGAEEQIRQAHAEPDSAAWVAVVVRVATSPVVQVAVGSDAGAKERE